MSPTIHGILTVLPKARLGEVAQALGMSLPAGTKNAQTELLATALDERWKDVLAVLVRDELKAACRAYKLDDSGRDRTALSQRLLAAARREETLARVFSGKTARRDVPSQGDIVRVRHRQYLVEETVPPPEPGQATLLKLVCLDDDNQGRPLEVLWELELGARLIAPEATGLGKVEGLDSPRAFGAYLHALNWNAVTATDAQLFQAQSHYSG